MRDRIIERHQVGQGYRKISKEMNLALSTLGNIIRKYKKYEDSTANCHVIAHGDEEVRLILSSRVELALSSSQKVTVKRECGSQRG